MPTSPQTCLSDELERQRLILRGEMPERVVLTSLAFALCAVFADLWLVVLFWAIYLGMELAGLLLLTPQWMLKSPWGYATGIFQTVLVEAAYISAAGLVWQLESPYSKAFAVGMTSLTMMHLATIRSIHLPIGLAGMGGVAAAIFAFNSYYWLVRADAVGLALSSVIVLAALAYTFTAMLSNNRVHQTMVVSASSARAAHDAKTFFLAQMSHELRTPLNAIIGMGQAELTEAEARNADSPSSDRLRLLVDQARMLGVILDDVTDMNAVSHGQLPLRLRAINLQDEVQTILSAFRERAQRLGITVTVQTESALPAYAKMDPVRLRQTLGNVLSNAVRHAHGGRIRILLRFDPAPDGAQAGTRGVLVFDVADTGPGVPPADREMIFDAFHKGRDAAPGSGLGLAIARTLARRMGGDLILLPTEKGARFQLSIGCQSVAPPKPGADTLPDLTGRIILVVDDIASNRMVAASYLRSMGALVIDAESGEAALSVLAAEEVDLMLLDMNMPGLDGFQTAARARMMGGRAGSIPIVAMTADVMGDQVAAVRQAGFDGYLAKPLLPETMAAEIARLI